MFVDIFHLNAKDRREPPLLEYLANQGVRNVLEVVACYGKRNLHSHGLTSTGCDLPREFRNRGLVLQALGRRETIQIFAGAKREFGVIERHQALHRRQRRARRRVRFETAQRRKTKTGTCFIGRELELPGQIACKRAGHHKDAGETTMEQKRPRSKGQRHFHGRTPVSEAARRRSAAVLSWHEISDLLNLEGRISDST